MIDRGFSAQSCVKRIWIRLNVGLAMSTPLCSVSARYAQKVQRRFEYKFLYKDGKYHKPEHQSQDFSTNGKLGREVRDYLKLRHGLCPSVSARSWRASLSNRDASLDQAQEIQFF